LKPIGHHRQQYTQLSKGKRSRKRKRNAVAVASDAISTATRPPVPEISSFIDIGLASISRNLEKAAGQEGNHLLSTNEEPSSFVEDEAYAAVFVVRSGQSSAFHCHFPQMVAVASKRQQSGHDIRLVGLSKPCADRLSSCLGLPRVSSVGIRNGAPNSSALVNFARSHVSPVQISWVMQVQDVWFRKTKINAIETTVGVAKQKKRTTSDNTHAHDMKDLTR
jgi:ribonuclease P/MRP protein subunit POP3